MNHKAIILLYIPLSIKGQRRCEVEFEVNPIGSGHAYSITSIRLDGTPLPVDDVMEWNSIGDVCRAIDISTHYEWAKKELGIDLKKLRCGKKIEPPQEDKRQIKLL